MNKIVLVQDQTDKISQIIKPKNNRGGLYLGNQIAATNLDILKSYNITAIITIAAELPNKYPSQISHLRISIDDQPLANIYDYLEESYNFIKKQLMKGNVFVHCRMGVSRSASIIIAYLMRKYRCSYNKAYTSVKAKRPKINPNEGFVMQLKKYGEKVQQLKKKSNSN